MIKQVRGKDIRINNLKTIEKAFEGMVISSRNTMVNGVTKGISLEGIECASNVIKEYFNIYEKLPFPLNSIEEKIKYACIAMILQYKTEEVLKFKVMENGLTVGYNKNTGIHFFNTGWKLVNTEKVEWDDYVDIGEYRKHPSYTEYEWVVSCIIDGKGLNEYYKKFMSDLYDACKGNKSALRRELASILYIKDIPEDIHDIRENSILDVTENFEYTIDIFMEGKVRTGEDDYSIIFGANGFETKVSKAIEIIYNFEVYKKKVIVGHINGSENDSNIKRIAKVEMPGAISIFEKILTDGIENSYNKVYRGIKCGDNLVFSMNGNLYRTKASEYVEPELVKNYVDIVGAHNEMVYYYSKERLTSGVIKNTLYELNSATGETSVCLINFD